MKKFCVPSLREAFGQEPDPKGHLGREPEPKLKHPGQAMPTGIGAGSKKDQTTANAAAAWLAAKKSGTTPEAGPWLPGATPRETEVPNVNHVPSGTIKRTAELPPTAKQSLWQQTQDFLAQHGSGAMAGVKPGKPSGGSTTFGTGKPAPQGWGSMASAKPGKQGAVDMSPVPNEIKPKFKGKMIGQTFTTAGKTDRPNVAWQKKDPETGELGKMNYGRGQERQTKHELVWNGNDWVTKGQFGAQFGKKG